MRGYVSRFLRVVPPVPTLAVVAEPLLALGTPAEAAKARAAALLRQFSIPEQAYPDRATTPPFSRKSRVRSGVMVCVVRRRRSVASLA